MEAFVNERLPSEVLDATELYNMTVEEVSEEEAEVLEKGAEVRMGKTKFKKLAYYEINNTKSTSNLQQCRFIIIIYNFTGW